MAFFSTEYNGPPCKGYWTEFFNRDTPSDDFDLETLFKIRKEYGRRVCREPIGIDARLLNGKDYSTSGEVVVIGPRYGFSCKNENQLDGKCEDYKVRFCCR
ncbi:hypothetical protein LOTGIDRAFT_119892 [Lottia gigantea]|uniref:WxxW domain-containing protein n=1 Tax=Lottia gigantea TaxID=225164 RepID=V3ZNS6_LOTGI|nr:hypothetical protein LOTGIDRAFT_119892 [Lottia gigantea]ESO93028.1 hypothetical protein LOTGIDRAFT_119892 [Lottia gigantea]